MTTKIKYMKPKSLYELLRRNYQPRLHPNGFVQIDMDSCDMFGGGRVETRVDVFHPDLLSMRQQCFSTIHDHSWDLYSQVLVGRLANVVYDYRSADFEIGFTMHKCAPSDPYQSSNQVVETNHWVDAHPVSSDMIMAGECYSLSRAVFHETLTSVPTVTLLTKTYPSGDLTPARLLVPIGETYDDFDRNGADEEVLWRVVKRALDA